jgi:peptidoglycan/LPS O-acetylase OafA/YrhL
LFPGCKWLGWWGHRSYSLYLWHAPVLRVFVILAAVQAPWIRDNYWFALGLAAVGAVAALYVARFAYWCVERHFINTPGPDKLVAEPRIAGQPVLATAQAS